jgi:hypothetical protein
VEKLEALLVNDDAEAGEVLELNAKPLNAACPLH